MKYVLTLEQINNSDRFVIAPGTELYHGTGEDFTGKLKPGGYDGIIWTTDTPGIAQTYIPVSGSIVFMDSSSIRSPTKDVYDRKEQVQLGIDYDYDKVEFFQNGNVRSYTVPDVFKDYWDINNKASKEWEEVREKIKQIEKDLESTKEPIERKSLLEELRGLIIEEERKKKVYYETDIEKAKNEYVNKKLSELGYEPESEDTFRSNHRWKLKTSFKEGILPAKHRSKGRLYILTANERIIIYDLAGDRDGDLTNLEYHKHDIFKMAKKKGYDGVRINDFAQIESEGNFGHISFGLFPDTIDKFNLVVIDDVTHPDEDEINRMYRTGDWTTKEYREKFGKIKNQGKLRSSE